MYKSKDAQNYIFLLYYKRLYMIIRGNYEK
jgi:hypothetical protein